MVRRGSDPCGCPSWSDVDPTVRAVAEAMAKRDGYKLPGAAGVLKNFLPLAEVAVAEVRRLDGPVDPLTAPLSEVVREASVDALPTALLSEVLDPATSDQPGVEDPESEALADESEAAEALLFFRLVDKPGSLALSDR